VEFSVVPLKTRGTCIFNGFVRDISERKRTEKQLLQAAMVMENTIEAVMVLDADRNIQVINTAFSDITGYAQKEVIGKSPQFFHAKSRDPTFYNKVWAAIEETGKWQGEIWNRRKNDDVYPEWMTINAIKGDQGQTTNYVSISTDITERKLAKRLNHLAHHDALTNLPNRLYFNDLLLKAIALSAREKQKLAIMFIDLDRFKSINDTLGHDVGDSLLQEAANRLTRCVREMDTVASTGGDEFLAILPDIQNPRDVSIVCERILQSIAETYFIREYKCFVSASIGISMYPVNGMDADTLIKNADIAMFRVKTKGRKNYQFYTKTMGAEVTKRLTMESALRRALELEELQVVYQPQVELISGKMIGLEALLRWRHPEMGQVDPSIFIPLAEDTGLIIPIGEWVLRAVCEQSKVWLESGLPPIKVAVNFSAHQFAHQNIVKLIVDELKKNGLDPAFIEVEITEGSAMADEKKAVSIFRSLHTLGVPVTIDDFGTGFSSLSYLKHFPINILKIDQSFIREIPANSKDKAIAASIIDMAHNLELGVIAEGVETKEQLEFLDTHKCDIIQGYFFSRPLPTNEITKLIQSNQKLPVS